MATRLAANGFSPDAELAAFIARQATAGAVASFVGIARPTGRGGGTVRNLFLDHHPRLTLQSMEAIGSDGCTRFELADALIVHRVGDIGPGEAIVFVAAAATHRRAAFEAADYMMDRLKSEAVFWKREDRADGSEWIEPTEADARDLDRWSR